MFIFIDLLLNHFYREQLYTFGEEIIYKIQANSSVIGKTFNQAVTSIS